MQYLRYKEIFLLMKTWLEIRAGESFDEFAMAACSLDHFFPPGYTKLQIFVAWEAW